MTVRTVWLALALLLVINLAEGSKPSDEASDLVEELVPPNDSRSKPVQAFVFPAWFGKMSGGGDKRNPGMYSFGLGKRSSKNIGPYSFGLGKRTLPSYSFGLGKRDDDYWHRDERSSRFGFGLGKRSEAFEEDDYENGLSDEVEPEKRTRPEFNQRNRALKEFPLLGKRLPVYNFGLGK